MFTPIVLTGRPTEDLELKTSQNGGSYVQFSLAVNKGFGDKAHANFYSCVFFGNTAERIVNAKVKKGSLINIIGDLDITEYDKKDGTKGISHKVNGYDWEYIPVAKAKPEAENEVPVSDNDGFMNIPECDPELPFN